MSVHLPVGLLSLAFAIFLISQIGAASRLKETMTWQLDNLEKQSAQVNDTKKKITDFVSKRDDTAKQAGSIKKEYENLLAEVLELSKSDADAAKIVEKYKVQRSADPTPPAEGEKKPEKPEEPKSK
jgi:cell shape-determining protein MreC